MNQAPILRSQMVPAFVAVFRATGGDVEALARRFALPANADALREVDLPLGTFYELSDVIAAHACDENMGLHLAIRLPRGSYGLLEYIGRSASTVRRAGERFIRYSTLLNDLVSFTFEERAGAAVLTQRVPGHPSCVGRQAGDMFLALVVRYIRELTDSEWDPIGVGFAQKAPADTSELASYFRAPLTFECGENRVELPLSLLDRKVVTGDAMLFDVLDQQAAKLVASLPAKSDPLSKVRVLIRSALEDGQPQLDDVARELRVSTRTLQRRISDEGTTFQRLIDDVRKELATQYIANPKLALGEVAYLLGFSEISAFTRAFRRWTGTTPSKWRAGS